MKRVISLLAVLMVAASFAATNAAASTPTKKCPSSSHSEMDGMDMSGSSKRCTKETNRRVVPGAREIAVTGDDFAFSPDAIAVKAGENVAVVLTADDIAHDFFVKGVGHVVHAKAGKTARGGLRLEKPGTYSFWCTVSGHRKAGMTGTITVTS
jgi:plastocyanin